MKKIIALGLLTISLISLAVGCNRKNVVLEEVKTYEVTSEIHSLDIQINAADFKIESVDKFLVESNLKHLSVSEQNGVLKIVDKAKGNCNYTNAVLTLYVPQSIVFDEIDFEIGAAKLQADALSARTAELKFGAGDVRFDGLNVSSEVEIEGGAGEITIVGGSLNNLALEVGVGELNLTAALLGSSDLEFGVGESNITLLGSKDDYKVDVKKGIGSITIDGEKVSSSGSNGNGKNRIEIEGGVGAIRLKFHEN